MGHSKLPDEKYYIIERQKIDLAALEGSGCLLDIGGGGEGVIGRIGGNRVIAIDNNRDELVEAPAGPLKTVMDAADLHFVDQSFALITAFFSFMYISSEKRTDVMRECFRVLKPSGRLLLWEVTIPDRSDPGKEIFVMPIEISLPSETITTAYGVPWKDRRQNLAYYAGLAEEAGFRINDQWERDQIFYLEMIRSAD